MHALRIPAAVFAALFAILAAMAGSAAGCGSPPVLWICDNPINGKADNNYYDGTHFVNDTFDPCHCYDPSGPLPTCPIVVDAGPDAL
jgi:hypothetical protein